MPGWKGCPPPFFKSLWHNHEPALPVALVQFQVSPEPQVNRQQVRHWLERAMAPGQTSQSPKLLMLPEVWNSPYQAERFAEFAEPILHLALTCSMGRPRPSRWWLRLP